MDRNDIDTLIPHRGTLKLIERITFSEGSETVSSAVVNKRWPLYEEGSVHSLVCIELIAQTAAAHLFLVKQPQLKDSSRAGWLAGMREAQFYLERLTVGDVVNTRVSIKGSFGKYTEIAGSVFVEKTHVCDAVIQVVEA